MATIASCLIEAGKQGRNKISGNQSRWANSKPNKIRKAWQTSDKLAREIQTQIHIPIQIQTKIQLQIQIQINMGKHETKK